MTQKQKEGIVEVIRDLQTAQVEIEKQDAKTRDVNLIPQCEAIREATGKLSALINPSANDSDGKPGPGPGPEETEPKAEKPGPSVFTAPGDGSKERSKPHA